MDPIVGGGTIDLSPERVLGAIGVALAVVVIAAVVRQFLLAASDEAFAGWRWVSALVAIAMLRRRPSMPAEPWFCRDCRSQNLASASLCYKCGAERAVAEAPVPDAEPPTSPTAGLTHRRG